jgi:peptidyl-prolyl cis-trans isomerase C
VAARDAQATAPSEYAYHLLRASLDGFRKSPGMLEPAELARARRQADKTYDLECLVLSSSEAAEVVIADGQVAAALAEIAGRYESQDALLLDLEGNGLDGATLRRALHRELLFDAVMQRIGSRHAAVHDLDVRLFYEVHKGKFEQPEKRRVRHILITVNPDFEENGPEAARARIDRIKERLGNRSGRFARLARKHSECPSALEGGKLGKVARGQLYPELDAELFVMEEGAISNVVETKLGFHLLWCETIEPGVRVPLSRAWSKITEVLIERRRRNCQKAWIAGLRGARGTRRLA